MGLHLCMAGLGLLRDSELGSVQGGPGFVDTLAKHMH